jgi:hypothetical protein
MQYDGPGDRLAVCFMCKANTPTWGVNLMGHAAKRVIQSELVPGRLCSSSKQTCLTFGGQMLQTVHDSAEVAQVNLLG